MRKTVRVFFRLVLLLSLIVSLIVIYNALTIKSKQIKSIVPVEQKSEINQATNNLSAIIQQATISNEFGIDTIAFINQDSLLRAFYPLVYQILDWEQINDHSLVFHWKGTDSSMQPILFTGHLDVVPIDTISIKEWNYGPFSGHVDNNNIWGRGSLDDKINVIGLLDAVNRLLEKDFQPARDIYLAFGHDEEIGGNLGAKAIAEYFANKGLHFEFVLDEGLVILEEALDGLGPPLAMIGIAEKGYCNLKLEVDFSSGGHSSMPSDDSAISILSNALHKISENPFPAKLEGASMGLLKSCAPEMSFLQRCVFSNTWLTGGLIKSQLIRDPASAALVRTTIAPTIINAGIKENVVPGRAHAIINFRILPGEDLNFVQDYISGVIDDDRVKVKSDPKFSGNPTELSSTESFGFRVIQKTIHQVFPKVVVAPGLVIATTDSRHYRNIAKDLYRFTPIKISREELKTIHGNNEHISLENLRSAICFYEQLIVNSSK